MHPRIITRRTAEAMSAILDASQALGAEFNVPAIDLSANRERNPEMRHLYQLEAVAQFLTAFRMRVAEAGVVVDDAPEGNVADLTNDQVAALQEAGLFSPERLSVATDEQLLAVPGIGPKALEKIRAVFPYEPAEPEPDAEAEAEAEGDTDAGEAPDEDDAG